jgi:protein-S-isoprenylcysteine O-methyltransferase Ste14
MSGEEFFFGVGLLLLLLLGAGIGKRLAREYRANVRPTSQTVAAVWLFYALHFILVVLASIVPTWSFSLPRPLALGGGLTLCAVGAVVHMSAAVAFRSLRRMSGLDTSRLVTEGIYSWSRNPQIVGWTLVLLGLALVLGSTMVLLLTAVFWLSFRLYLPLEEELLTRIFGDAYETYSKRTHRYFGPPGEDGPE